MTVHGLNILQNAIGANMTRPVFPHESRRSMISLIFQKHPCATEMSVSNSPCILEEYVKVGDPNKKYAEQEFLPNSNSISALLAVDTSPQKSHQKSRDKLAIKFGHLPLKICHNKSKKNAMQRFALNQFKLHP